MVDRKRVEAAVRELIAAIGDDVQREGLATTPQRVAEAYEEFFAGVGEDPLRHLVGADVELDDAAGDSRGSERGTETESRSDAEPGSDAEPRRDAELVLLRGLRFRSMCEHHLLPFTGVAHVAYLPGARIVGLGRVPRVIDTLAARPQLQERLTEQIADTLEAGLRPRGVLVVVEAAHGCMMHRGPLQRDSTTVTIASRGALAEPVSRAEILGLIALGQGSVPVTVDGP